jgi:hypothetical protein
LTTPEYRICFVKQKKKCSLMANADWLLDQRSLTEWRNREVGEVDGRIQFLVSCSHDGSSSRRHSVFGSSLYMMRSVSDFARKIALFHACANLWMPTGVILAARAVSFPFGMITRDVLGLSRTVEVLLSGFIPIQIT